MDKKKLIQQRIQSSIDVKNSILNNDIILNTINAIAQLIIRSFKQGNSVWLCGNGGSAADAQHIAAELSGRYYFDRPPLPAEALHVNTSYLTAVANDYGYDDIYARYIMAVGKKGDVLIGISTSGNSKNVVNAFKQAKEQGLVLVALTGEKSSQLEVLSDYCIKVPSLDTPRIQETHILIGHILCELVESDLFNTK
ncbi:MAG: D-sedoheptulose 7-phosphate isomerase [Bacteroidales bacterium]|nr:D-sedoheptulose 7-phosphate isomerase [Bacteroidales bacterium]